MTLVKTLAAVAALLPSATRAASAEICVAAHDAAADYAITTIGPAICQGAMMMGVATGFVTAVAVMALICCACPCMRPRCSGGGQAPNAGVWWRTPRGLLEETPTAGPQGGDAGTETSARAARVRWSGNDKRSVRTRSQIKYIEPMPPAPAGP